jgi:hypothetical protein
MRRSRRVATSREMLAARSIVLLRFAIGFRRDVAMQQLCACNGAAANNEAPAPGMKRAAMPPLG